LLGAGVNVIPAGIFVLGAGTLVYGLAPRFAAVASAVAGQVPKPAA
jgi:putative exporter of polyketide antibiotics